MDTRERILHALAPSRDGLTVEALTGAIGISRSGIRQHLTALERDGLVTRAAARPSGGRPELQYVLTDDGRERFPRQYSWFAELLLQILSDEMSDEALARRLEAIGREVGAGLAPAGQDRAAQVASRMVALGYDAKLAAGPEGPEIQARNCVFHKLAQRRQTICRFDIAMLEAGTGQGIDHCACMARGDAICRFRLLPRQN